jgi:acetyltransferase-like isoleucine patch superfamily enzyme
MTGPNGSGTGADGRSSLRRAIGQVKWQGQLAFDRARVLAKKLDEEPAARIYYRNQLIRPWRVARFHHFGAHSVIDRPVAVYGAHHIYVGDDVGIGPGCTIFAERAAWSKPAPVLKFGDRVIMRGYSHVSATELVEIEDHVCIGAWCTVIDSNHLLNPDTGHIQDGHVTTTPVRIGAGTWIADRVAILPGAEIGKGCFIGSNSVVNKPIPDFSVALGFPARVVGSTLG